MGASQTGTLSKHLPGQILNTPVDFAARDWTNQSEICHGIEGEYPNHPGHHVIQGIVDGLLIGSTGN